MTELVTAAAPGGVVVNFAERTITGLCVPYGKVGQTSAGRLTYATGSLRWTDPTRVKLLVEHGQPQAVGYGLEFRETPDGLIGRLHVPPGAEGDRALTEAHNKVRDGLSVGVQLDDAVVTKLRRAQGQPVPGSGDLREVSLVAVPAFDDARVAAVASTDLVVTSWCDPTTPPQGDTPVTAPAQPTPQPVQPTPVQTDPAAPVQPAAPAQPAPAPAPAQPAAVPAQAPSPAPLATAGAAALVTGEPSTYSFSGDGPSLVRDAWAASMSRDAAAAERLHRYNAELVDANPASVMALAAVLVTDNIDGAGGDGQQVPYVIPARRPDLIRASVDRGRPITARLPKVPVGNATPFYIPTGQVEFDGVALHTEGTAHVPEGSLAFPTEVLFAPKAMSGAFRLSREVIDATNPAIDRVALAAMLKDYRRKTEAVVVAAVLAADGSVTTGVNTVNELRARLIDFGDDDTEATMVLVGKAMFRDIALDNDTTNRPLLPYVAPSNAAGTIRAGYTGLSVDGSEVVKSSSLPTDDGFIIDGDGFLVAESATQTFRFDEVEGPGIIKLALFGYFAAEQITAGSVDRFRRTA